MIAHVSGVPVEETLVPLLSTAGAGLLLARAWFESRVQRHEADSKNDTGVSKRPLGVGGGVDGGWGPPGEW
jgi:hypothetical protein